MKTSQRPDKRIHIRKKVAGGTTGAVLGAVVGGPVGALVGGVIGTVVGGAAESGKLQALTREANRNKPVAKAKGEAKRIANKMRSPTKRGSRSRTRVAEPKNKSKGQR